jgi:hypothetical protein
MKHSDSVENVSDISNLDENQEDELTLRQKLLSIKRSSADSSDEDS